MTSIEPSPRLSPPPRWAKVVHRIQAEPGNVLTQGGTNSCGDAGTPRPKGCHTPLGGAARIVKKEGVHNVHTSVAGLVRTSAGLGRNGDVFGSSQHWRGLESVSSPTSGTVFPQVRGRLAAECGQNVHGWAPSGPFVGGRCRSWVAPLEWIGAVAVYLFMADRVWDCMTWRRFGKWALARCSFVGSCLFMANASAGYVTECALRDPPAYSMHGFISGLHLLIARPLLVDSLGHRDAP
jgi:hypothetical protein